MTTQPAGIGAPLEIGFGDRMRRLRISLGLNQEQFAEAIDVPETTLAYVEIDDDDLWNAAGYAA